MKIQIGRIGDNIVCAKDYSDIDSRGEISHIFMEIEIIRRELMELWEKTQK
jgi:hypothetical protein